MIRKPLDEGVSNELSKNVLKIVFENTDLKAGDLAEALDVDKSFISLVRSGKRSFRIDHLLTLEAVTGLPLPVMVAHARPMDDVHKNVRVLYRDIRKAISGGAGVPPPPPKALKLTSHAK